MTSSVESSSNGSPAPNLTIYSLPDELFKFTDSRGRAYTLDLHECHLAQNEIGEEHDRQIVITVGNEKPDQFFYLRKFKAWLKTQGIPPEGSPATEDMRLGELDRLWHELRLQFIRKKKEQNEEYETMQRLLSSTASGRDN